MDELTDRIIREMVQEVIFGVESCRSATYDYKTQTQTIKWDFGPAVEVAKTHMERLVRLMERKDKEVEFVQNRNKYLTERLEKLAAQLVDAEMAAEQKLLEKTKGGDKNG